MGEFIIKKKITFIINDLNVGGTEKQLFYLIKSIKKYYDIRLFSFNSGRMYHSFSSLNIKLHIGKKSIPGFINLIFFLLKNKTDLYHFFLPKSYIVGGILTFFSKKKKIMSRRSLNNYHKKYLNISLLIEKILHKRMQLILTNTGAIKNQLIMEEGIDGSNIKIIKNFIFKKKIIIFKTKK